MDQLDDNAYAAIAALDEGSGGPVIRITGELDISNIAEIEAQLISLIDGSPPPPTIDLSALSFMDSSGIAMLLRAADKIGPLTIRDPSTIARQIIVTTGLGEILRLDT